MGGGPPIAAERPQSPHPRSVIWHYVWPLVIAIAAIALAIFLRFPPYSTLGELPQDIENQAMVWQIEHPFSPIPAYMKEIRTYGGPASHVDKMELRVTMPLLGRFSHTGRWTVVVWSHIAGIVIFYWLAWLAREATRDRMTAALFTIGLGATFFGAWPFSDFIFGDAVAFALILCSVGFRSPALVVISILGAAFCDERTITAVPLSLLYFAVRYRSDEEKPLRNRLWGSALAGVVLWLVLRVALTRVFHLTTGTSALATRTVVRDHLTLQTVLSLIGLFRASWSFPVLAVRRLILQNNRVLCVALVLAFGIAAGPAFLVIDFNRSLCYAFLTLLISLHIICRDAPPKRKYFAAVLSINILINPPGRTALGHQLALMGRRILARP
jgi:hypothetical protein